MLVLLASRHDYQAALLAERWKDRGACLLTCEGLSQLGWRHESAVPERSFAVLEGQARPVSCIRGVLSLLWSVTEAELPHIVPEERSYVAAEMQAFLLAWLSVLPCPVLNAPTALTLNGPGWRAEQWLAAAHRARLPVRPLRRTARAFASPSGLATESPPVQDPFGVSLIGERCIPDPGAELSDELRASLRRLAGTANVQLLSATFGTYQGKHVFVGASPCVDLSRPELANSVLEYWESKA